MIDDHGQKAMDTSVGAGEFKAKCLQLLDQVARDRESLTITKRGRPVARVVPIEAQGSLFGALRGSVIAADDLIAPVDERWDAEA